MQNNSALAIRMKKYESVSRNVLMRRVPVIIRVDGRAFHTFCKRFSKPYDTQLNSALNEVTMALCKEIQGAKFASRHSDEISILVVDFETLDTEAYFDYVVQKICSVVAGKAAVTFCQTLLKYQGQFGGFPENYAKLLYPDESWPVFDCRAFNVPLEDVANYFYWRQLDCVRASINMFAQTYFSHKELQNKTCDEMQEMMFQKVQFNWGGIAQNMKTGFICVKQKVLKPIESGKMAGEMVERNIWSAIPAPAGRAALVQAIRETLVKEVAEKI